MNVRKKSKSSGVNGAQFLALSLFIMLLAFFIVLNSISSFNEDKVSPILNNIESVFASKIAENHGKPSTTKNSINQEKQEANALDQIENIFKAQIPNYRLYKDISTGKMYIRVKKQAFEYALQNMDVKNPYLMNKEGFDNFLGGIIYLLQHNMSDKPYKMEIYLNLPEDPAAMYNNNRQKLITERQKLSDMATILENAGLPKKLLNIGLQKGASNYIDLYFGVYKPIIPKNNQARSLQDFLE